MAVRSSHRRARSSFVLITLFALTASLSGSALAATPPTSQLTAQGPQAAPDDPPSPHGKAVGNKHRLTDQLSAMGLLAQKQQAKDAKKNGHKFETLDKELCDFDCEEDEDGGSSDPDAAVFAPGGQAETSMAMDSTGQHVVIGFNDTRGFSLNPVSVSGFMYSDDGGLTFTDGGQLPTPGNQSIGTTKYPQVFGDPEVKYLGGSNFVYFSIMVRTITGPSLVAGTVQTMSVHVSTDYGHTWSGPFEVTGATNPHGIFSGNNARDAADKEFADYDPATGRLLMSWSNFTSTAFAPGGVEISTTYTDNILATPPTWSTRTIVAATANDGQSSIPRAAGSNTWYVAWRRSFPSLTNNTGFARSTDGGNTWSAPINTAPAAFFTVDYILGNDRVNTSPGLAVDRSGGPRNGYVYTVYANNANHDGSDVAFQRSTTGGVSFEAPLLLNSRPGNDRAQWFPWITVDNSSGRVYVFYYDQGIATTGDLTETTYLFSDDGGTTWSTPRPLSARPYHAGWGNDTGQPNLGDYNQAVAQSGALSAVWAETRQLGFADGQPSASMTTPDVTYRRLVAGSTAPLRLGAITFTDSGNGGNGSIDASENVTLTIPLSNYVTNALSQTSVTGISATLTASTPGVVVTQGSSGYPNIGPGGAANNTTPLVIQTTAGFALGTPIEIALSVTSAQGPATLLYTLLTGTPAATTLLSENFNGVAPGALPAGWATAHGGGANTVPWTSNSSFCGTSTNAAFHTNANDGVGGTGNPTRFERLFSPLFAVPAGAQYVTIDMDVCYDTEDDPSFNVLAYDGFTLRVTDQTAGRTLRSVLAEAFETTFKTGAIDHFPKHFPRNSSSAYFEDMSVWAGDSAGVKHVSIRLPGMAGSTAQLRFEFAQDGGETCADVRPGHTCGVQVDNLVVRSVVSTQPADVTPPSLTVPPDQFFEATSFAGAIANYAPCTATDDFVSVSVSHDIASGSLFPLGVTTVHCTATDAAGNSTSGSFGIHVVDTTPPSLTAPAPQTFEATSGAGAVANYTGCTAADTVGPVTIAYSQASGTVFPIGGTTVTCVAIDEVGNSATATFQIIVQDTTAPVVTFTGNTTPYTVDQTLNIICSYTDAVGVVSNTCVNFVGPAFGFGLGAHSYTATATDAAGNTGSATLTFEIRATATSLCTLVTTLSTKAGVADSLCAKLDAAAASLARGEVKAHDSQLNAFKNEVSAQAGKAFTDANAAFLIAAANSL